jgi:hypothetical protein
VAARFLARRIQTAHRDILDPTYRCGLHREHTQLYATALKAADFETGVVTSAFAWQ